MSFKLGQTSLKKLEGVHSDLVKVIRRAIEITEVDFTVLESLRTKERQVELMKAGATTTLNSRHITGHAVDLGAWVSGEVRWDWPLYFKIADAVKRAAKELKISVEWGGDWKSFKDGPHFELSRKDYP